MTVRPLILTSCLCLLPQSQPLHAQFSLKPRPLPAARAFLVTEVGYAYRVTDYAENFLSPRHYFTSAVGFMVNIDGSWAIGGTTFVGINDAADVRGGLQLRLQRWRRSRKSIDVGAGLLMWDSRVTSGVKTPVVVASARFRPTTSLGLTAQLETVRTSTYLGRGTDSAVYLGVTMGSTPGLIGNVVGALVAAAAASVELGW